MSTQVMMPLQTHLATSKPGELSSSFWLKTPQHNKFRQSLQDKNVSKKRRHNSEQLKNQFANTSNNGIHKTMPCTPKNGLFSNAKPVVQSSPYYAGAKFSEAPLPSFLPKPPTHWINSNNLNAELNDLITTAVSVQAIENTISIIENNKICANSSKPNKQSTSASSKYYVAETNVAGTSSNANRKQRSSDSVTFQYNLRDTRRSTPQCQTKCKNPRYSSFSRQNIHQKIAAVN